MGCLIGDINARLDILDTCPPIEDYKILPPLPTVKMNMDALIVFEKNWIPLKNNAHPFNEDLVADIDREINSLRTFWEKIFLIHCYYGDDIVQTRASLRDLQQELNGDLLNVYSVPHIPWWRLPRR